MTVKALEQLPFIHPIAPDIYLADGPNGGRFPCCNAFLVTGHRTVLIDAGIGDRRIREIDRRQRIDSLIISHSHPDHMLAWHTLADRELLLPVQTPEAVHDLLHLGLRFTGDPARAEYWADMARNNLNLRALRPPNRRFADGEVFDLGTVRLKAIHAPGHLDDHYGFLETRSGTLFSTDIDFTGFGPWYGNPESDIRAFIHSIATLRRLPFRQICSSHKPPIHQAAAEAAFDDYLKAFARQRRAVLDLCRRGMDLPAMLDASPLYRNKMPDPIIQRIFEAHMIRQLTALLTDEGRIVPTAGGYRITNASTA